MTSLLLSGQAQADVFSASADLSLQQTARVTAARFDFIIEGEVVEANPVTHASATGCIWVTELRLGHLREIKGTVADTYLLVTTLALPEELPAAPPGGCSHAIYYDTRPPQVGQRGIFLLDLHPEYGIFLQTVEYGFLPRQTTGLVTIHLRGSKTWSYEAFRSELQHEAALLTLEAMLRRAEVIALADLADATASQFTLEDGVKWTMCPFTTITIYRGQLTTNGLPLLRFSPSDNQVPSDPIEGVTQGILGRLLSHRLSDARKATDQRHRVLILGTLGGLQTVIPFTNGLLPVNDKGEVQLGLVAVSGSKPAWNTKPLSVLEEDLRP